MSKGLYFTSWASLSVLALAVIACGPPPPPPDDPHDPPAPTRKRPSASIEAEIGALDAGQVQAVFSGSSEALKECYVGGVSRIGFLGGEIKLAVRVDQQGATTQAFVKESTLGDRTTESCMVRVLKRQTWPKPQGGKEGTAETSFLFEPSEDERPPIDWSEGDMGSELEKAKAEASECRRSAGAGPMRATLYVETDGKVLGVGVSGADAKSEEAAGCVVKALTGATYSSPGSYAAKVTLSID